jgi:hypothetical protein
MSLGRGPLLAGAVESYPACGIVSISESASDTFFDLFEQPVVPSVRALVMPGLRETCCLGPCVPLPFLKHSLFSGSANDFVSQEPPLASLVNFGRQSQLGCGTSPRYTATT